MASRCKRTCAVRRNRDARKGKNRKAKNRNQGTTLSKEELFQD